MPEISRPSFTVPDDIPPKELGGLLRKIIDFVAQQIVKVKTDILQDPRFGDKRVASGLRCMEGVTVLDTATAPNVGDVLYCPELGRAVWGTPNAPSPTDPGVGPLFGGSNALLDGDHHTDTVAQAVSRGSLVKGNATPKWDEFVIGSALHVLRVNAAGTDLEYAAPVTQTSTLLDGSVHTDTVAQGPTKGSLVCANATPKWDELPVGTNGQVLTADSAQTLGVKWAAATAGVTTREVFLGVGDFEDISAAPIGKTVHGTAPDAYVAYDFDPVFTNYVQTEWLVPADYGSGNVTAQVVWATDGSAAGNYAAIVEFLNVADGSTLAGAGGNLVAAASGAVAADLRITTTVSTFNPGGAGNLIRIVAGRDPGHASDTWTGTVRFVGVILTYTSTV